MRCSIKDIEAVHNILSDEMIYPHIIDDGCGDDLKYKMARLLLENPAVYCLMPNQYTLFIFFQLNYVLYEGHMQVLKNGRGREAVKAGKDSLKWMFKNTPCEKIIGFTPDYCKEAVMLAIKAGMKREGILTKSWKKDGILYDQIITGVNKGDVSWQ